MPVREPAFMVFGLRMTAWGSKRCSLWGGGKAWLRFGKRVWTAEEILAYEARKAESARWNHGLKPSPPKGIGRLMMDLAVWEIG
jgi:hypothetical protein